MAKKYHSNGKTRGAKAVNKGVIGIIVTLLIAALLLGAAVGVLGYGTSGFKDWSFSLFAPKNPAALEDVENDIPDMGSSTIIEQKENNGMAMLSRQATLDEVRFYAPVAMQANPENVFQLSVTYEPAETTFQETDYTIAFKNPGSEWATGKNVQDYVQLTHVDDSKEATITILQAFSEQIIVTARCQKYSNIFAKTTVDYVCEYFWMDWNLENGTRYSIDPDCDYGFKTPEFLFGTIHPELKGNVELVFQLPDLSSQGYYLDEYYVKPLDFEGETCTSEAGYGSLLHEAVNAKYQGEEAKKCWLAVQRYLSTMEANDGVGNYAFSINRVYKGKSYGYVDMTDYQTRVTQKYNYQDLEAYQNSFQSYFEVTPNGMNSNTPGVVGG